MGEFVAGLMSVCGGISVVGGAVAVIVRLTKPATGLRQRIEKIDRHEKELYDSFLELKQLQTLMCKGLVTILENEISGTSGERVKAVKEEIQEYLILRG